MKLNMRSALLGGLTVLALSGIASASASASACKKQAGSTRGLCIAGSEVLSPTKSMLSAETVETNATLTVPSWERDPIVCKQLKATGTLTPGATRTQSVALEGYTPTFSKCAFKEGGLREECTLSGWTSDPLRGAFAAVGSTVNLVSEGRNGFLFEWEFKNGERNCPAMLRGDQRFEQKIPAECTLLEAEVEKISHTLRCEPSKAHIIRAEEEVTLGYEAVVSLTGEFKGQKFSVIET